ncbi:hypothetical protein [Rhodococcus pyridinivorans]|uniref:hypothetical protein n=1 Tax=Rhodococcus pyridinivorans TaxID=103816 RepID=UPI00128EFB04|nr:hypothetical protein [Rhodococcus pyridinivorans]
MIMILAQEVANQAPTATSSWAVPIGVVIGALIALVSTSISDRRKLKYEDRRRWDSDIRVLTSQLLADSRGIKDRIVAIRDLSAKVPSVLEGSASLSPDEVTILGQQTEEIQERLNQLPNQIHEFRSKSWELRLIAPQAVSDAASELETATVSLLPMADDEAWNRSLETLAHRQSLLVVVARSALTEKGMLNQRLLNKDMAKRLVEMESKRESTNEKNAP